MAKRKIKNAYLSIEIITDDGCKSTSNHSLSSDLLPEEFTEETIALAAKAAFEEFKALDKAAFGES